MPFRIVRNDITRMTTEAIVNTAGESVGYGSGCDTAVHKAAGEEKLLAYRREHIGNVPEGEVFLTPGFDLPAKYIIHAVSPLFIDGQHGEEEKLRSCYRKSLELAVREKITSVAFPLISTGSFGYPRTEGFAIAVDEIRAFLEENDIDVCLVVFGEADTGLGKKIYPKLESYIDNHYVSEKRREEYGFDAPSCFEPGALMKCESVVPTSFESNAPTRRTSEKSFLGEIGAAFRGKNAMPQPEAETSSAAPQPDEIVETSLCEDEYGFLPDFGSKIDERMEHLSDNFSEYLFYLIEQKGLKNADVWKRGLVDRKTFSKIKNNPDYHPQKMTALCLCVGACLNLDESRDLLARAGYAFSPCDKTDIIFSFFIENKIYDMVEVDIQLEEHDLPCLIS